MGYIEPTGECLPASYMMLIERLQDHRDEVYEAAKNSLVPKKDTRVRINTRPVGFDTSHGYDPVRVRARNNQRKEISKKLKRKQFQRRLDSHVFKSHQVAMILEEPHTNKVNGTRLSLPEALNLAKNIRKQITSTD